MRNMRAPPFIARKGACSHCHRLQKGKPHAAVQMFPYLGSSMCDAWRFTYSTYVSRLGHGERDCSRGDVLRQDTETQKRVQI